MSKYNELSPVDKDELRKAVTIIHPAHLDSWIVALESRRYMQGAFSLRCGDSFCCLGVFLDVNAPGDWSFNRDNQGRLDFLHPDGVVSEIRIEDCPWPQGVFERMNDVYRFSLSQIAACLRDARAKAEQSK